MVLAVALAVALGSHTLTVVHGGPCSEARPRSGYEVIRGGEYGVFAVVVWSPHSGTFNLLTMALAGLRWSRSQWSRRRSPGGGDGAELS